MSCVLEMDFAISSLAELFFQDGKLQIFFASLQLMTFVGGRQFSKKGTNFMLFLTTSNSQSSCLVVSNRDGTV